jgi:hypothetical protein
VSPGPTMITVVASRKMTVVIPNTNMCPRELNKEPLELQGGEQKEVERAPECYEKHEAHRRILMEMQYTAKYIPKYSVRRGEGRAQKKKKATIGETGPEIVRDGIIELCVDCVEEEFLFSVGH